MRELDQKRRPVVRRPGALGITGTPGTGKKSVARALAPLVRGELLEINALAGAHSVPNESEELVVDVRALGLALRDRPLSGAVVSGHLLADVLGPADVDFVAVLRCDPAVLKRRLVLRRYSSKKVLENVEAELIGVVLDEAVRRFGASRVHEYDSTKAGAGYIGEEDRPRPSRRRRRSPRPGSTGPLGYDSSTKLRSLLSVPRTDPAST